ncbi:MAG: hypothetical protein QM741_08490 [Rudaea sp.]|uniref:hypothetical protein n=1 Tax=Rudaea sp. TaxID=2136325 RepID=UPI0039E396AF
MVRLKMSPPMMVLSALPFASSDFLDFSTGASAANVSQLATVWYGMVSSASVDGWFIAVSRRVL